MGAAPSDSSWPVATANALPARSSAHVIKTRFTVFLRLSVDAAEYSRLRLRPQSAGSGYLKRYPVSGTRMRPPAPGPKSAEASATGRPPASSTRAV